MKVKEGDASSFDENWRQRKESHYSHWTRGEPQNQIQLAFRSHWLLFKEILASKPPRSKRVLEVGCGRATMSAYFSDNGYDVTALDLSPSVIEVAREIFESNGLQGKFVVGDALALDFPDKSFDVVVSIGLLEHFEDVSKVISEQIRILDHGGLFLGYIVPENVHSVQQDYHWLNDILRLYDPRFQGEQKLPPKAEIYRSDHDSKVYVDALKSLPVEDIQVSGVYPVPMISPSVSFPFTLMPEKMEARLVAHFTELLKSREKLGRNPWLCDEKEGQAFLVWCWKK